MVTAASSVLRDHLDTLRPTIRGLAAAITVGSEPG